LHNEKFFEVKIVIGINNTQYEDGFYIKYKTVPVMIKALNQESAEQILATRLQNLLGDRNENYR